MWPSSFISGDTPHVEQFALPTLERSTTVTLVVDSPVESSATIRATSDPATALWSATIPQAKIADASKISFHVEAATTPGSARSSGRTLAVLHAPVEITPTMVTPIPTTRLIPWGAGDGQVGNVDPGNETLRLTPASVVAVDDSTWIVDRANQRVARIQSDGTFTAIAFPADQYLGDIVAMAGTPFIAVLGASVAQRHGFMTTFLIDRTTMAMTSYGPEPVPAGTPPDLPFLWEPATQTLYAEIPPELHPVLRIQPEPHYVIGERTVSPMHTEVSGDRGINMVVNGAASFYFRLPFQHPAIEESTIAADGTVWFITGAVDTTISIAHFWLVHFDPRTSTVRAVELPATVPLARLESVRSLTVQEGKATVMRGTQEGLVLDTFEF